MDVEEKPKPIVGSNKQATVTVTTSTGARLRIDVAVFTRGRGDGALKPGAAELAVGDLANHCAHALLQKVRGVGRVDATQVQVRLPIVRGA